MRYLSVVGEKRTWFVVTSPTAMVSLQASREISTGAGIGMSVPVVVGSRYTTIIRHSVAVSWISAGQFLGDGFDVQQRGIDE